MTRSRSLKVSLPDTLGWALEVRRNSIFFLVVEVQAGLTSVQCAAVFLTEWLCVFFNFSRKYVPVYKGLSNKF